MKVLLILLGSHQCQGHGALSGTTAPEESTLWAPKCAPAHFQDICWKKNCKQQNNLLSIKQDFTTITVPGTENSACLAHSHTTHGKLFSSPKLMRFRSGMWLRELQGGWRVKLEAVLMIQPRSSWKHFLSCFFRNKFWTWKDSDLTSKTIERENFLVEKGKWEAHFIQEVEKQPIHSS